MAQIEGAYLHEKLDGTVWDIALYDSVEDVGDCYYQCGYRGQTAYIAATEDKESGAYQKYGTPATFRRKDGTEFWLLTQPYPYYLNTTDIDDVPASGGSYALEDYVDTNADSVAYEVEDGSGWLSIVDSLIGGIISPGDGELIMPARLDVEDAGEDAGTAVPDHALTVAANTDTEKRTGTVKVTATFSDGSTLAGEITVSQEGKEHYLNLKDVEVDCEANNIPLALEGYIDTDAYSLEWEYVDGDDNWQDWLQILHADEPLGVEFEFTENTGSDSRTARFDVTATFDDETVLSGFISITQRNGGGITAE